MNHEHISSDLMTKLKQKVLHLTRGLWFSDIEIALKNMNDFPLGASPSLRAVSGCCITIIPANHVFLNKEGGGGGGKYTLQPQPHRNSKGSITSFLYDASSTGKKNSMRVN